MTVTVIQGPRPANRPQVKQTVTFTVSDIIGNQSEAFQNRVPVIAILLIWFSIVKIYEMS